MRLENGSCIRGVALVEPSNSEENHSEGRGSDVIEPRGGCCATEDGGVKVNAGTPSVTASLATSSRLASCDLHNDVALPAPRRDLKLEAGEIDHLRTHKPANPH